MEYGDVTVVDELRAVDLAPDRPDIYDRDIGVHTLFEDPRTGARHFLIRYPEGLRCALHRHTAAHTMVVVDGALEVNGRVIGAGSYAHFPGGEPMRHAPAPGRSCLVLVIFDGMFDVERLDG